jgi:FkbM family methyltransferase
MHAIDDIREGVIWATRLLLDREPTESDIALLVAGCSMDTIRRVFVDSAEYKSWLSAERVNRIPPAVVIDRREGLKWAFRLFLGRELDDAAADLMKDGVKTASDIRDTVIFSNEFRLRAEPEFIDLISYAAIGRFAPFATEPAARGSFRDFIGTTTRCSFLPREYLALSGTVQHPPMAPYAPVLHGAPEWVATLRSVIEAKDRLVVLELGAGWAPWLVAAAKAAEKKGVPDLELVGVEGSLDHVGFMTQHFRDNSLDPDAHRLIHGVVGTADGIARFPKLADPQINYGAEALFNGEETKSDTEEVRCLSLETLLTSMPIVDLVHCDIQGAESVVLAAARDILGSRVRRIVIGTHSRRIEDDLMDLFGDLGWWLEHESACRRLQQNSGKLTLYEDGTQVWRNPAL